MNFIISLLTLLVSVQAGRSIDKEYSDQVEPDALHKFIYWERKHLNPYEIEDFLKKNFGWTPPLDYLMSLVPESY